MGRRVRMICTVGTSLVGPHSITKFLEDPQEMDESMTEAYFSAIENEHIFWDAMIDEGKRGCHYPPTHKNYEARERTLRLMREINNLKEHDLRIMYDENFGTSYDFPTAETQTILRWLSAAMRDKDPGNWVECIHPIFLPSQDAPSKMTAHASCICLDRLKVLFKGTDLIYSRAEDGIIPLQIKVGNREDFLVSISELFNILDKQSKEAKDSNEEFIICSTGGFKAVSGFAMMYAQIHSIPCLYTFESSEQPYEVMSLPLGYAYASLDEEITMLKAIEKAQRENQGKEDDNPKFKAFLSAFPKWIQDSKELAGELVRSYESARKKPYGVGEELFNRLRSSGKNGEGEAWAEYIENLLEQKWSQLWLGDQIPETVEHSRRHSKRLMEFAANLFRCAEPQLERLGFTRDNPNLLAVLIATIYLHDIGHTALSYPIVVNSKEAKEAEDIFPLGMFPSAVREVHNLLTGELLRSPEAMERYFTRKPEGKGDTEMRNILALCVPLVSEHHRGYTTLQGALAELKGNKLRIQKAGELLFGESVFQNTLRPLEDRYKEKRKNCPIDTRDLLNLTALMRIIDGCDVQADRVIGDEYLEYRNRRSEDEAFLLDAQLRSCQEHLPKVLYEQLEQLRQLRRNGAEVKEKCEEIYPCVFEALGNLKACFGNWQAVQRSAMPYFIALSWANRFAFKLEQSAHFEKHRRVGFVLPARDEGNTVTVQIFPKDDKEKFSVEDSKSLVNDVEKEYSCVSTILSDSNKNPIIAFKAKVMEEDG